MMDNFCEELAANLSQADMKHFATKITLLKKRTHRYNDVSEFDVIMPA